MESIIKNITKDIQQKYDDMIALAIKKKLSTMTILTFKGKHIPYLHNSEVLELVELLKQEGYKFEIEENESTQILEYNDFTVKVELTPPTVRVYKEVKEINIDGFMSDEK